MLLNTLHLCLWILQRNASNASQVTIEQVETNISGKFSCEVSVEPSFHTMIVSGDMEVVG